MNSLAPDQVQEIWVSKGLITETEYMYFVCSKVLERTSVWEVRNRESCSLLGVVKWHGLWRQYCFFAQPECVLNRTCLGHLDGFIGQLTDLRKGHEIVSTEGRKGR